MMRRSQNENAFAVIVKKIFYIYITAMSADCNAEKLHELTLQPDWFGDTQMRRTLHNKSIQHDYNTE